MATVFADPDALKDAVGTHLGFTDWMVVDQDRIDRFADATGDHQWIHVDPDRARSGPFGATVAHGYLTLSLVIPLFGELLTIEGTRMGINYGVNKVRFPTPVTVGSRIRGGAEIVECEEIAGGVQVIIRITVEIDGAAKPACVARVVYRQYA
jgi:acyl dehydratase